MVYKAMPPLYMVPKGKKKEYYLDNTMMAKENRRIFKKTYTMADGNRTLTDREVEDIIIKNADYLYEIESAATTHGCTPKILETVLINYVNKGDFKSLEKAVKNQFRFAECKKVNGIAKIEISEDQLYTVYYVDSLFEDCKRILKIMQSNDKLIYTVNGEKKSMYDIMKIFDNIMPAGVQRYKGLGEQDYDELRESTTDINSRSLIRYTVEDVKEEIERIRRIESDRKQILNYVSSVSRDDLIGV